MINSKKLTFQVGYTEVSNLPLSQLAGEGEESAYYSNRLKAQLSRQPFLPNFGITSGICTAGLTKFDARNQGIITPVRRQQCGNCWAYAAVAAFEANYTKTNGTNPNNLDASEQHVVSCSNGGSCSGGLSYKVFDWMKNGNKNLATEAQYPDLGVNGNCPAQKPNTSYYIEAWGSCRQDGDNSKIAPVSNIKAAICQYGSVKTSFTATTLVQNYTNGVINEFPSNYSNPSSNHAVIIVGWDDTKGAWLIKNSWGTNWGMNGYGWIAYGSNNIGRRAIWVKAKKITYQINPNLVATNKFVHPQTPVVTNTPVYTTNFNSFNAAKATTTWTNKDRGTRGITKLIFKNSGKKVQAFGSCSPTDCDWGTTDVKSYRGRGYQSYATFNSSVGTKTIYINQRSNQMSVKLVSSYRDGRRTKTSYYNFDK